MQVAFDKAGQDGGLAVIGQLGLRPGKRQQRRRFAHGADLVARNRHSLRRRLRRIHRQNPAQKDQIGDRGQLNSPAWTIAARIAAFVSSISGVRGRRTSGLAMPNKDKPYFAPTRPGSMKIASCNGISRS